jgi:hypothetical protein
MWQTAAENLTMALVRKKKTTWTSLYNSLLVCQ